MKIITAILILIVFNSFGQTVDSNSTKRILLGIVYSPDYCYRTLNASNSNNWDIDLRDSLEIPKIGFTTGLSFLYKINKRFSIESGLQYSDKGDKTKVIDLNPLEPDPSLPTNKVTFTYHYQYIDIPIKVNYFVNTTRLKIFLSAGLSTNIFLNQRTTVRFIGSKEKRNSSRNGDFSRINIAGLLGIGVDYDLLKNFNIRIEPIYRHSIISIVNDPIKQYSYSIGANFGLFYKLN